MRFTVNHSIYRNFDYILIQLRVLRSPFTWNPAPRVHRTSLEIWYEWLTSWKPKEWLSWDCLHMNIKSITVAFTWRKRIRMLIFYMLHSHLFPSCSKSIFHEKEKKIAAERFNVRGRWRHLTRFSAGLPQRQPRKSKRKQRRKLPT